MLPLTCPRNPVVPLSTKGTSAARQRRLTCRLASRLSRPFKTTLNCWKNSTLNWGSLTFAWHGVILIWGLNFNTASRATWWHNSEMGVSRQMFTHEKRCISNYSLYKTNDKEFAYILWPWTAPHDAGGTKIAYSDCWLRSCPCLSTKTRKWDR